MDKENKDNCEFPYIVCYLSGTLKSFDKALSNAILFQGVEGALIPVGKPQRTLKWVQALVFSNSKELPLRFLIGKSRSEPEKFQKEAQAALLVPRELANTMINYYRMPLPNTTESSRSKLLLLDMIVATVISESYYTRVDDTSVQSPQDLFKNFLENEISDPEKVAELVDAFIPNYPSAAWSINRMKDYQKRINKFMLTQVDLEVKWSPLFGNLYMSSKNSTSNVVDPNFKFPFDDQVELGNFLKELKEDFATNIDEQLEQKKLTFNPKDKIGKSKNKVITKKNYKIQIIDFGINMLRFSAKLMMTF